MQSLEFEKGTHTRALVPPSLVNARRKVAWKARGKIRHCLFFFTTPYALASEPEESQIAEAMKSMASKSGTERARPRRANAPTYSAPAGPSRASP